jgi:general secretion pathway protein F
VSDPIPFRYSAVRSDGSRHQGALLALDRSDAVRSLRQRGLMVTALDTARADDAGNPGKRVRGANRQATLQLVGELAVLLKAGLPLDRAMALAIDNIEDAGAARAMAGLLAAVREGATLSRAMDDHPELFTPADAAMAEAGEASGQLAVALERLAAMLEQAAALRRMVGTAMIYPLALMVIALGVIALMLLFVVPQFEHLLDTAHGDLPAASMAVIGASRLLRADWPWLLLALGAAGIGIPQLLRRPGARTALDRTVLALPLLGELVRRMETARMAHTLGALVEGGVPLPHALALAQRTIGNSVMASAVATVATGLRQGGGLAGPLAQTGVLPRMAVAFLRTGEESSQLALMLGRLAQVLDRDVRTRLERLVAILTPTITVILGASVAGIIAAIMSAILGFNDLAVAQP